MKRFTIIAGGGSGKRFGNAVPKQFSELAGKPVLMHTMEKFFPAGGEIILVLPADFIPHWKNLCEKYSFTLPHSVVTGGDSRTQSVKNGLNRIQEEGIVAIHDAVRPLVTNTLIEKLFSIAEKNGNAVPVISIEHSMRKIDENKNVAVDRTLYKAVQTPQCFHVNIIKEACLKTASEEFSDDASVLEAAGTEIILVEGEKSNIKITTPQDLLLAEAIMKAGD